MGSLDFSVDLILPAALQQMYVLKLLVLCEETLKVVKRIIINDWKTAAGIT
jgi:hypothetical protein